MPVIIRNLTLLLLVALAAPAAHAACDVTRLRVTGKTVQQCIDAFTSISDPARQPCALNPEWRHTAADKLNDCTRAAMDKALDSRLLRLKKADPPQFRREMKMQASFNRGESAVCSSLPPLNPSIGWLLETQCRTAHRLLRVKIDAEIEQGKLSFPDNRLQGPASDEHRAFAEALCAMPAKVFEGGAVPDHCVDRVLGTFEKQCQGIAVRPAPKSPEGEESAELRGETSFDPRKWVDSVNSEDDTERKRALADPLLGRFLSGPCPDSDEGCSPSYTEFHLEKETQTEVLLEFPGVTQRLVLLQPVNQSRWRVIWSVENTTSEMMCDVTNPYSASSDQLTSANHESLKLTIRTGSITSPAAGGGCNYGVQTSWYDLHGSHLEEIVSCLECTVVPEGPFPRKVLSTLGELFAPDKSGTYKQIAGPKY